ncbi:MAG: hypothetical protein ACUVWX_09315 [Kiritimatiellia bacterium]
MSDNYWVLPDGTIITVDEDTLARHNLIAIRANGHLLAGVAKRSVILSNLEAAFALEATLPEGRLCAVAITPELEKAAAPATDQWPRGRVMGALYVARLDSIPGTPLRAVEVATVCVQQAVDVLRYSAACSKGSFPLRGYPMPLIEAHRHAHLSGLEAEILKAIFFDELGQLDEYSALMARKAIVTRAIDETLAQTVVLDETNLG